MYGHSQKCQIQEGRQISFCKILLILENLTAPMETKLLVNRQSQTSTIFLFMKQCVLQGWLEVACDSYEQMVCCKLPPEIVWLALKMPVTCLQQSGRSRPIGCKNTETVIWRARLFPLFATFLPVFSVIKVVTVLYYLF